MSTLNTLAFLKGQQGPKRIRIKLESHLLSLVVHGLTQHYMHGPLCFIESFKWRPGVPSFPGGRRGGASQKILQQQLLKKKQLYIYRSK